MSSWITTIASDGTFLGTDRMPPDPSTPKRSYKPDELPQGNISGIVEHGALHHPGSNVVIETDRPGASFAINLFKSDRPVAGFVIGAAAITAIVFASIKLNKENPSAFVKSPVTVSEIPVIEPPPGPVRVKPDSSPQASVSGRSI